LNFEYKYVTGKWKTNNDDLEKVLNQYGNQGWEYCNMVIGTGVNEDRAKVHGIIFKRGL
jgi:hypothetical protein